MIKGSSFLLAPLIAVTLYVSTASAQQQFPIIDRIADKVIQKYRESSCPQLKAQRNQPKGPQEQRAFSYYAMIRSCAGLLSTESRRQ
jgi:hypothetical protein